MKTSTVFPGCAVNRVPDISLVKSVGIGVFKFTQNVFIKKSESAMKIKLLCLYTAAIYCVS